MISHSNFLKCYYEKCPLYSAERAMIVHTLLFSALRLNGLYLSLLYCIFNRRGEQHHRKREYNAYHTIL